MLSKESSYEMSNRSKIIYTFTDEAPALATYSLLPIIEAFTASSDIDVETRDISLAARVLSSFPESLRADQQVAGAGPPGRPCVEPSGPGGG